MGERWPQGQAVTGRILPRDLVAPIERAMSPPRPPSRTPWIALAAALVLLVQGAFPTWAVARAMADTPFAVTMCGEGAGRDDKVPAQHDSRDCCDPCVFAVALAAPAPTTLPAPVRYAVAARPGAFFTDAPSTRARDPPRPPSQAPPKTI